MFRTYMCDTILLSVAYGKSRFCRFLLKVLNRVMIIFYLCLLTVAIFTIIYSEAPRTGFEPARPCGYWISNPAQLPAMRPRHTMACRGVEPLLPLCGNPISSRAPYQTRLTCHIRCHNST